MDQKFQNYIQAIATSEQLWQTLIDSQLMLAVSQLLEKGLPESLQELGKNEAQLLAQNLCAIVSALVELNLQKPDDDYHLLTNIIQPTSLTQFPVGWLALRPFYFEIKRIAETGYEEADVPLLESLALLMACELVKRQEDQLLSPDPEGSEAEDMSATLAHARYHINTRNIPRALQCLSSLTEWFKKGGSRALGESLPEPIGNEIPNDLLTSTKLLVQHINRELESETFNQMTIQGVIYATHPNKGGVLIKKKQDIEFVEICKKGTTPAFKSPEQFRRWIRRHLGVKGRRTKVIGWKPKG